MSPVNTSRRDALKALGAGTALSVLGTGTAAAAGPGGGPVFEFGRMVGNDLTGADGAIRGVDAGGLPWVVDEAEAKLDEGGTLKVEVEGLVLADEPSVPEDLRLTNPVPQFRAILSCLSPDAGSVDDVRTGTFEANEEGDSEIEETLSVPEPCLAPIVLVAGPEEILGSDAWFAVTSG